MFYCPYCGKQITDVQDSCPACGYQFDAYDKSIMTGEHDEANERISPDPEEFSDMSDQEYMEEEDNAGKPSKRLVIILVIIAACAAVAVIFFVRWRSSTKSTEETEDVIAAVTPIDTDANSETDDQAEDSLDQALSEAEGTFVLPESDSRYYSEDELKGMTSDELRIARNEIYARHGRKFDSPDLQSYFDSQPWYTGTVDSSAFGDSMLNQYEKANVATIQSLESGSPDTQASAASANDSEFEDSWKVIQSYGFDADDLIVRQDFYTSDYDYTSLSIFLFGGTGVDNGDYYTVRAEFDKPVKIPGNMQPGESYTATVNELTGETSIFTFIEENSYGSKVYDSPDYADCYAHDEDANGMVELYFASEDRIDAPFHEGVVRVRKDAITGNPISSSPYTTVDISTFSQDDFFNAVGFDKSGYIAQLIYVGD